MKNRRVKKRVGFPVKSISYFSKEYATAYAGVAPEKVKIARAMSKHHGMDSASTPTSSSNLNSGAASVPMSSTSGGSTGATVSMSSKSG